LHLRGVIPLLPKQKRTVEKIGIGIGVAIAIEAVGPQDPIAIAIPMPTAAGHDG